MKQPCPTLVTDHAFVRYLELVLQVDVEQAKREILAGGRERLVALVQHGTIKVHEKNLELIVRDGQVVTLHILHPERMP